MIVKIYELRNKQGMHVRPAGMIADVVSKYNSDVKIVYNKEEVDARSVVSILGLGVGTNAKLKFIIDGEDEENVLKELDELIIEREFDEKNGEKERE